MRIFYNEVNADELPYNQFSGEQLIPRHWRGWLYRLESGRGDPLDGAQSARAGQSADGIREEYRRIS